MVTKIPLSRGLFAIIDDEDFPLVGHLKWHVQPQSKRLSGYYAVNGRGGSKPTAHGRRYMHRVIIGAQEGEFVDHINGNGLDNRRSNLRIATVSQNNANRIMKVAKSGVRGVTQETRDGRIRFRAETGSGVNRWRGPTRHNAIFAAFDYDKRAVCIYGEFARLNFPCVLASRAKGGEA